MSDSKLWADAIFRYGLALMTTSQESKEDFDHERTEINYNSNVVLPHYVDFVWSQTGRNKSRFHRENKLSHNNMTFHGSALRGS